MEIVTGNELLSGAVVYFGADGNWHADIGKARVFSPDENESRDSALASAKASLRIVSLEIESVEIVDGGLVPERLRTRIRAEGPTAPYGPERQELGLLHVSL